MLSILIALAVVTACASPSSRQRETFVRPDGRRVVCSAPPPDVIAKSAAAKVDLTVKELGDIARGSVDVRTELERVRRELSPDIADFEVIDFRLCQQFGNGVLKPEEYRMLIEDVLPKLR